MIIGGLAASLSGSSPGNCANGGIFGNRVRNGIQIFPGGFPLYRNGVLIGGIGVSGDGIDQDDTVGFFGASRSGLDHIGRTDVGDPILGFNAPKEIRSDSISLPQANARLRYANCPEAPLSANNDQNICEGE